MSAGRLSLLLLSGSENKNIKSYDQQMCWNWQFSYCIKIHETICEWNSFLKPNPGPTANGAQLLGKGGGGGRGAIHVRMEFLYKANFVNFGEPNLKKKVPIFVLIYVHVAIINTQ